MRAFGRTSERGAPVTALLGTSVLVTVLVLLNFHRTLVGVFTFFVLLSTTSALFAYLACSLALVRLRARGRTPGSHGVTAWLGVLGCVGALYSIGAIAGAGKEAVFWGVVLLLAGVPMFVAVRKGRGVAQG